MDKAIYDYFDYRLFLKDYVLSRKARRSSFSLATLTQKVPGVSKPLLSLIINGKRNLASAKVEPLGRALALNAERLRYFRTLVHFNQARTTAEKEFFLDQLVALRPRSNPCDFALDHYQALRTWHCMVLRELIKLPDFDPSPAVISKRLGGRLKPAEAKRALEILRNTGMVQLSEAGAFSVESKMLKTSDDIASVVIRSYHKSCLELGRQIIDETDLSEREFSSVNAVLTAEQFRWVKNQIKKFRDEVGSLPLGAGPGRKVFQMNIQFFPLAEEIQEKSIDVKQEKQ